MTLETCPWWLFALIGLSIASQYMLWRTAVLRYSEQRQMMALIKMTATLNEAEKNSNQEARAHINKQLARLMRFMDRAESPTRKTMN